MLRAREFSEGGENAATVTAASQWTPIYSVDPGVGGFVEVAGFDGFFAVRSKALIPNSAQVELPPQYQRIGPAGSRTYFRVDPDVGIQIQVRCLCPFPSGSHADVETGVYTSNGTRTAKVVARWLPEPPITYTEQVVQLQTTYGDIGAIAASADSVRIYPTGYAREYRLTTQFTPLGTLDIRTGNPGGQAPGPVFDVLVSSTPLALVNTGRISAWDSITISNDNSQLTIVGALTLWSPDGRS